MTPPDPVLVYVADVLRWGRIFMRLTLPVEDGNSPVPRADLAREQAAAARARGDVEDAAMWDSVAEFVRPQELAGGNDDTDQVEAAWRAGGAWVRWPLDPALQGATFLDQWRRPTARPARADFEIPAPDSRNDGLPF